MDNQELDRRVRRLERRQNPAVIYAMFFIVSLALAFFGLKMLVPYETVWKLTDDTLGLRPVQPSGAVPVAVPMDEAGVMVVPVTTAGAVMQPMGDGIVIQEQPAVIISTGAPPQFVESVTQPVTVEGVAMESTKQFWADCAYGQGHGLRVHPQCPPNAGELLGTGR